MLRDNTSLLDIVQAGQLILQFTQGITRNQLESDLLIQSAILYQISIMEEATISSSAANSGYLENIN